jgi:hypothetical protein
MCSQKRQKASPSGCSGVFETVSQTVSVRPIQGVGRVLSVSHGYDRGPVFVRLRRGELLPGAAPQFKIHCGTGLTGAI